MKSERLGSRDTRSPSSRDAEPLVLLIDGECVLCAGIARFVAKRDPRGRFRFASLQSRAGGRLAAQCSGDGAALPDSFVLIEGGRCYTRSEAALRVLRRLPRGWRLLYALKAVPPRWRDAVYDAIAARRRRWFGRQEDACLVPHPMLRNRLLTDGEKEEGEGL
ncbi:thiol-disulfide oxidoreductase DCC family protein [Cohnella zeiphila]|uniref:DUF393 domain-containing protein n=1 Tax=Cohnella zeiphila TaxID=2761120 RepID=A0A7X0SQF8_9BACL|nr:DCC1-like thiol-disulfide oxidoreductase family protein [Cohnella zeiphila]MBB6734081.1 DUF393 domain-containing protein [Cohnella zeiphila]